MARIQFGQSTCQIEGTYVPAADFGLAGDDWIYFSHHTLLWTDPTVEMQAMPMAGGWNRMRAGLPLVMMQAAGPGHLALSDDASRGGRRPPASPRRLGHRPRAPLPGRHGQRELRLGAARCLVHHQKR